MAKIIETTWVSSPLGTIGFVLTEDEVTGTKKLYCGAVSGLDEGMDTGTIAENGGKVPIAVKRMIEEVVKSHGK